jgi:hypothetical protein
VGPSVDASGSNVSVCMELCYASPRNAIRYVHRLAQ